MTETTSKGTLTTPKKPRKRRFNTYDDVRRYVVDLINRFESDEIDLKLANQLTYIATIMMQAIAAIEKSRPKTKHRNEVIVKYLDEYESSGPGMRERENARISLLRDAKTP